MEANVDGYRDFIARKHRLVQPAGFTASMDGTPMFPFQRATVEWACKLGRAALNLRAEENGAQVSLFGDASK